MKFANKRLPGDTFAANDKWIVRLLVLLGILALLGCILLQGLIRNDSERVIAEALGKTFLSQHNGWTVSGDVYAETGVSGGVYGFAFQGGYAKDGRLKLKIATENYVSGTSAEIVRPSNKGDLYMRVTGIKDITGAFVVGGAAIDKKLQDIIVKHKDDIDGTWYKIDTPEAEELSNEFSLPDLQPIVMQDTSAVKTAYSAHPFLHAKDISGGEILLQSPTRYYEIAVDHVQLEQFLQLLRDGGSVDAKSAESVLALFKDTRVLQVWINKKSHLLEQVRAEYKRGDTTYTLRARFIVPDPSMEVNEPTKTEPFENFVRLLK